MEDAAVRGIHVQREASDYPIAFITTKVDATGQDELRKDVVDFVNEKVASYKRLKGGVHVLAEIPRKYVLHPLTTAPARLKSVCLAHSFDDLPTVHLARYCVASFPTTCRILVVTAAWQRRNCRWERSAYSIRQ